jgi:hypothetical protein
LIGRSTRRYSLLVMLVTTARTAARRNWCAEGFLARRRFELLEL